MGFKVNELIIGEEVICYILSILKNPVIYMDVVYAGFAWSKNLCILSKVFLCGAEVN